VAAALTMQHALKAQRGLMSIRVTITERIPVVIVDSSEWESIILLTTENLQKTSW
jgi:hypothetical protein